MALGTGTRLGPYEILSPLGAGGMGEVYRARDSRLDRDVAIKILPASLSDDLNLKQRLEREAKAVSKLSHPHICTLHDIGLQDGLSFLVMELLDGETLFAGGKLKTVSSEGGTPFEVCDAPTPRGGAWSSKGIIVFAASLMSQK
jgi:serine/threonine protein kinase